MPYASSGTIRSALIAPTLPKVCALVVQLQFCTPLVSRPGLADGDDGEPKNRHHDQTRPAGSTGGCERMEIVKIINFNVLFIRARPINFHRMTFISHPTWKSAPAELFGQIPAASANTRKDFCLMMYRRTSRLKKTTDDVRASFADAPHY